MRFQIVSAIATDATAEILGSDHHVTALAHRINEERSEASEERYFAAVERLAEPQRSRLAALLHHRLGYAGGGRKLQQAAGQ